MNHSDRQRLTHHWLDLQQKFDEQHVDLIYKSHSSSPNRLTLGEIHLKTPNQDQEHLQLSRLQRQQISLFDPYDNQDGIYRSNPVNNYSFLIPKQINFFLIDDEWTRFKNKNKKTYGYN